MRSGQTAVATAFSRAVEAAGAGSRGPPGAPGVANEGAMRRQTKKYQWRGSAHILSVLVLWMLAGPAFAREDEGQEHRERGGARERERDEAREEREMTERYLANMKALYGFVDEATQLQKQLESGGEDAIRGPRAAWEGRVKKYLRKNLAKVYADDFANARYREQASPKRGVAYEDLEAKKRTLRAFMKELRKPD
jgi:hypothetical protein